MAPCSLVYSHVYRMANLVMHQSYFQTSSGDRAMPCLDLARSTVSYLASPPVTLLRICSASIAHLRIKKKAKITSNSANFLFFQSEFEAKKFLCSASLFSVCLHSADFIIYRWWVTKMQ